MEVKNKAEFLKKASENITRYLHRGGENDGDVPQLLRGTNLLNTIGIAMGLPSCDPDTWSWEELERAIRGELLYFEGKALESIKIIADQIEHYCGKGEIYVTVLPIEVYYEGKIYEIPLFRVNGAKTRRYYIDNVGRAYDSYDDWYSSNKLPPGTMAYPYNLKLTPDPNKTDQARMSVDDTPSERFLSKTSRGVDTVAAIAGLGSSVGLIFATGGLAAPLLITAVASAGWSTARAGYQIAEKATHGESVNPFTDSESRMLWLGVAASLTSFGAMGATMRLSSFAARGKEISATLRIVTNVANGTNVVVSGCAILNTSIYMISNHEDLTAVEVLMLGASIAFWTKGVFNFKTSSQIIRDVQNSTFANLSKDLTPEQADELKSFRKLFNDDAKLLQKYNAALSAKISAKDYSQFLIDIKKFAEVVQTMNPEQLEAFDSLRSSVGNDIRLLSGFKTISTEYNLSPSKTVEVVLNWWQQTNSANIPTGMEITLKEGNMVIGRAPPIKITELPQLSAPMVRFVGDHLSKIDVTITRHWTHAVPVLLELQKLGMFVDCGVTKILNTGCAVISLNGHLDVSIHKLRGISETDCKKVFIEIGKIKKVPSSLPSTELPDQLVKICVRVHRLRFECHRRESVTWMTKTTENHTTLRNLVKSEFKSFEKDRLYTFKNEVSLYKADLYLKPMMDFVSEMQPRSISEMVAYSEFVISCVENEYPNQIRYFRNNPQQVPANTKVSVWSRQKSIEIVFRDKKFLKLKFDELKAVVVTNKMVGFAKVSSGLNDGSLVSAIRQIDAKFGSEASAVYHILKHPTEPASDYVNYANRTIRSSSDNYTVTLGQDGDVRTIIFEDQNGKSVVLERDGSIILCSFTPKGCH